jgi:hypothetical protein
MASGDQRFDIIMKGETVNCFAISQRDLIIQPGVAATKEPLRWVANHKLKSTLKELNQVAAGVMQPRCG